jgi:hypothetical protein
MLEEGAAHLMREVISEPVTERSVRDNQRPSAADREQERVAFTGFGRM